MQWADGGKGTTGQQEPEAEQERRFDEVNVMKKHKYQLIYDIKYGINLHDLNRGLKLQS